MISEELKRALADRLDSRDASEILKSWADTDMRQMQDINNALHRANVDNDKLLETVKNLQEELKQEKLKSSVITFTLPKIGSEFRVIKTHDLNRSCKIGDVLRMSFASVQQSAEDPDVCVHSIGGTIVGSGEPVNMPLDCLNPL